jgi:two-component system response regulator HydG
VDCRVLSASNQDLRRLVGEGKFREDLFYRLNVITVELPPLRERAEDVPLLIERFLDEISASGNVARKSITEDAMMLLQRYPWPGNVRELRNEIQKAHALSDKVILPMVLSEPIRRVIAAPTPVPALGEKPLKEMVREVVDDLERRAILEALRRTRGRKAQAARMLGVSRPTLDAKIELLRIPVPKGGD